MKSIFVNSPKIKSIQFKNYNLYQLIHNKHRNKAIKHLITNVHKNKTIMEKSKSYLKSISGITMEENLKYLSNFRQTEFKQSNFIKPKSILYDQKSGENIKTRQWDLMEAHDSVAILIYHTEWKSLLLVRQFRPAVYASNLRRAKTNHIEFSSGFTYELCAGIVDKDKSVKEIAQEEILEECGYNVILENIKEITCVLSSIGTQGTKQTIFYTEVNESMKISDAGGHEGENIELLSLPIENMDEFIEDGNLNRSTGLLFAFIWFQKNILKF